MKLNRRNLLCGIAAVPFTGLIKVADFDDGEFEAFDYKVGGTPYISKITDEPPEIINYITYPGSLRVICSCRHNENKYISLIEHQTWECLYSHKEAEKIEVAFSSYMASEKWFAKKLYDEAHKPLRSMQHVPEFQWGLNPIKLKLCCIEYCGISHS